MQTSSPPNRTQSADNLHGPHNLFSGVLSHDGIEQLAGVNDTPVSSTEQSIESFLPHTMSTSFLDSTMDQEHNSGSISDGSLLRWVPLENPPVIQGVYAPPSLPVSDDFIDLDVYPGSVNTSDEEQGAPENDIGSLSSFQDNSRENTDTDLHFQPIPLYPAPVTVASGSLHPAREPTPLASTSNRGHNEVRFGQWNSFGQPSDPWGLYTGEVVSSSPPSMLCLRREINEQQDIGPPPSTAGTHPVAAPRQMTGRICASSPALEPAPASFSSSSGGSSPAPSTFSPPLLSDDLGREVRPPSQPLEDGLGARQQPRQQPPVFSDVGCMDVQLMPLADVASGSSITCTLVNLLRGLGLIDRYTLEDLCDYLPARKHRCPPRRRQRPYKPPVSAGGDECLPPEMYPTSSPPLSPSSSSSVSLSPHKRTTVCAAMRKKSTSLPSRIPSRTGKPEGGSGGGCLVNYLLTCSRLGSNAISDFLPTDSDPCLYCSSANGGTIGGGSLLASGEVAATSNCYQGVLRCPACLAVTTNDDEAAADGGGPLCHLLASDWRRGRSDGLVCVVAGCDAAVCMSGTTAAAGSSHLSPSLSSTDLLAGGCACAGGGGGSGTSPSSRPPKPRLSCLIAGRFLPGEESWRGVWPPKGTAAAGSGTTTTAAAGLVTWIAAWIEAGGVLFFAQLDDNSSGGGGGAGNDFVQNVASYELCWRHRLVVGVSGGKHIHLSNPLEVVSASWVLAYLARLTKLSVPKSDVMQLWRLGASSLSAPPPPTAGGTGDYALKVGGLYPSTTTTSDGATSFSPNLAGQDLSLLSQQPDIRWSRFNILGQVISTLRDYDSFMERQELVGKLPEASLFSLPTVHHHHPLDSLRSSLLSRQSASFSTSAAAGPHNGGGVGSSSSSTNGLPQECLSSDPNLVIPCAQRPGFSIFVLRKNKELLRNLLCPV